MPPILFLANSNYNYIDMDVPKSHNVYKVEIIFPPSLLHYEQTLSTFAWDAVCLSRDTLCWSVGALHTRRVPGRRFPQNDVLWVHLSGGQK